MAGPARATAWRVEGVSKEAPVGFRDIRLTIALDTDAPDAERQKLLELTERYCVVYQTLVRSPSVRATYATQQ